MADLNGKWKKSYTKKDLLTIAKEKSVNNCNLETMNKAQLMEIIGIDSRGSRGTGQMVRMQGHKLFPQVMCSQGNTLYLFDGATHAVWKAEVTFNSGIPSGKPSLIFNLANSQVSSIAIYGSVVHIASPSVDGGLYSFDVNTQRLQRVVNNTSELTVSGVSSNPHHVIFSDSTSSQLFTLHADGSTTLLSGVKQTGNSLTSNDGFSSSCSHAQPTVLCLEQKSIFVCDLANLSIRLITGLRPLLKYHSSIAKVFEAFTVHSDSFGFRTPLPPRTEIQNLEEACQIYKSMLAGVRLLYDNSNLKPNGPHDPLPFITIEMFDDLLHGTRSLFHMISSVNEDYATKPAALLSIPCEHHFSSMRSRYQMPTLLQYCDLLSTVIDETIKKATISSYLYFTHKKSYYPHAKFTMNKRVIYSGKSTPVPQLLLMIGNSCLTGEKTIVLVSMLIS